LFNGTLFGGNRTKVTYILRIVSSKSFQVSILPPLASIFVTSIASQLADSLISKGVETTTVWEASKQH